MGLTISPPHLEPTASPSPGEGSTSPAGTVHTSAIYRKIQLDPNELFLDFCSHSALFSPIEVKISPEAGQQKVRAWGPGLEAGVVGKSADFVVEAVGDNVGTLGKYRF